MSTSRTMPHLSAPVERTLTGTAASDAVGVTPSWGGSVLGPIGPIPLPFAGDDDN
ncbi:hypothetical protein [Streptosporangium carneum]|uniref:Uncharacterized protein n=1 Tax=Streptosporangium carneum TaxID=47481 RepID=A0A9W6IDB8_9ACTN|nr:hypothetical protein [Streptosporangium carneum]GLK15499.1 hypothetical protein GCM10017600_89160 [Streptosporangium carneum]